MERKTRQLKQLLDAHVQWIPAGTFQMGSSHTELGRDPDEGPQHQVELTQGFWMWRTEVTQVQFQQVMGYNPSAFHHCGILCPVDSVTWHEAVAFANQLSLRHGVPTCYECSGTKAATKCHLKAAYQAQKGKAYYTCKGWRLPTEAEWEYAARGNEQKALYNGQPLQLKGQRNAPALESIAIYGGNSGAPYEKAVSCRGWAERAKWARQCGTHPVATRKPNPWGLYDVLGNMWEWTWDAYTPYPAAAKRENPIALWGAKRAARGGSWTSIAASVRLANRYGAEAQQRQNFMGFRLVYSGAPTPFASPKPPKKLKQPTYRLNPTSTQSLLPSRTCLAISPSEEKALFMTSTSQVNDGPDGSNHSEYEIKGIQLLAIKRFHFQKNQVRRLNQLIKKHALIECRAAKQLKDIRKFWWLRIKGQLIALFQKGAKLYVQVSGQMPTIVEDIHIHSDKATEDGIFQTHYQIESIFYVPSYPILYIVAEKANKGDTETSIVTHRILTLR